MDSKECYELLGIQVDYNGSDFNEVVEAAFARKVSENAALRDSGEITVDEFYERFDNLKTAKSTLINSKKNTGAVVAPAGTGAAQPSVEEQTGAKSAKKTESATGKGKGNGAKAAAAVAVVLAIGLAGLVGYHLGLGNDRDNDALNNKVGIETTIDETTPDETITEETVPELKNYGDVQDEAVVRERAKVLVGQLKEAGIINPTTGVAYTEDEIVTLVQYSWGMYIPSSIEEIDILHLELLNLFISPLNTDPYLYHVVYASGNDDFKDIAIEAVEDIKPVDFASTFAKYGENGVYPLTLWMQQKREAIYSTVDREEINAIYVEVGQVMADIMKGNGCTITLCEDGKDVTYTFTSEQILTNPASAMLITVDAQLIFANHYEIRNEKNEVVDEVQTEWLVYNKFNSEEDPDVVSLEEIEAWINNGCEYEWAIDDVLINGQTLGQRIQGDMEGMALNNYTMASNNPTLTK